MDFSGARAEVEKLLKCFLVGTHNLTLAGQIVDIRELPRACRERVRAAESSGHAWSAWSTECGAMVAWATYDIEGSCRLQAHLLHIEWFTPPGEFHAMWCHCYPNRPTEWIIGRGACCRTQ
jgi:hypothetical protein